LETQSIKRFSMIVCRPTLRLRLLAALLGVAAVAAVAAVAGVAAVAVPSPLSLFVAAIDLGIGFATGVLSARVALLDEPLAAVLL